MSWWNSLKLCQKRKSPDDMMVSPEEEPADLPVFAEKVQETKHKQADWQPPWFFYTLVLKLRIVKFASSQQLPGLRAGIARKREETAIIIHRYLEMPQQQIIKFSVKRTNLVCSIVTQSWYRIFILMDSKLPQTKKQDCARDDEEIVKVRATRSDTKYHSYR